MPPWALPGKPRQGGLDVAMNIPRSKEQLPQRFVSQPELNMFMYFIPTLLPSMLPGPPTSFSSVTTVTGRTRRDAPWILSGTCRSGLILQIQGGGGGGGGGKKKKKEKGGGGGGNGARGGGPGR